MSEIRVYALKNIKGYDLMYQLDEKDIPSRHGRKNISPQRVPRAESAHHVSAALSGT